MSFYHVRVKRRNALKMMMIGRISLRKRTEGIEISSLKLTKRQAQGKPLRLSSKVAQTYKLNNLLTATEI